MNPKQKYLSIGQVASRCGVATSALRFYEQKGLIHSQRSPGGQRQYHRSMLRKISIIRIAQTLGISLGELAEEFGNLPDNRVPTRQDWQLFSRKWRSKLNQRITTLELMRDQLDSCIGCGCLSIRRCALYNPDDHAAGTGSGARFLVNPDSRK